MFVWCLHDFCEPREVYQELFVKKKKIVKAVLLQKCQNYTEAWTKQVFPNTKTKKFPMWHWTVRKNLEEECPEVLSNKFPEPNVLEWTPVSYDTREELWGL